MTNDDIVKAKIHTLIDKANNTTGESDTTLIGAVDRVLANYGSAGYDEGYAQGIEEGKQAEYDALWDSMQDGGKRTLYEYAFRYWSGEEINPKHPIVSTSMNAMFTSCTNLLYAPKVTPADGYFTSIYTAFTNCNSLKSIDWEIPVSGATTSVFSNVFLNCYELVTIKKLIIDCPSTVSFVTNSFGYCHKLENIEFGGTIRNAGLNLQWSKKLSKASIISLINALSDETSQLTVTLSLDAVKKAFETSEGANDGNTSDEWESLNRSKPYWSIALV